MANATKPRTVSPMIESLHAEGPYPDYADQLMLFGRLVGSWDIEGRAFDESGNVVIAPPRQGREPGEQSTSYDTAIRAYDPRIDAWRVTVVAPVYGATVNLIAREHDDEIWLEGRSPDNDLLRWTFSEFSDERVLWRGFVSKDEGLTWVREEEIILRRGR
jgi:hypothetical protein